MQQLSDIQIRWPIRDHLREAVAILEQWHCADNHPDTLPTECLDERWMWASLVVSALGRWADEENSQVAVLGFPARPGVVALRWLLEDAGVTVNWEDLVLTDETFARLTESTARVAATRTLIDPGPFLNAHEFCSRVERTVVEFGVSRCVVWDRALATGLPLSIAPLPWGWHDRAGLEEDQVLLLEP